MKQPIAHPLKRLLAYIIDWYLSALCMSLAICIFASIDQKTLIIDATITKLSLSYACLALILGMILVMLYFIVPQWIHEQWHGQSIGKILLSIRVVKTNGNRVDFMTMVLRIIVGIMLLEETFYNTSFVMRSVLGMMMEDTYIVYGNYLFIIISLISVIMLCKSNNRQMLHDKIADTIVVEAK